MEQERCFHCDEPTGRAGRSDDSLYDWLERGPYCPDCWSVAERLSEALAAVAEERVHYMYVSDILACELTKHNGYTANENVKWAKSRVPASA